MHEPRPANGISICIPNWNHRNYLPRSIGSAKRAAVELGRHGVGCQVLVVDDSSRDGSQRVLFSAAIADPTGVMDVVFAEQNSGLSATRNLALANARYRYACFMDADNELIPENLFTFWRAMRDTKAAFVYGNLLVDNGTIEQLISNDVIVEDIYEANYVDAFAVLDVDKVESLGGYQDKHAAAHEDWELLLHLISEQQLIVFVPVALGYYHQSDLSMIRTTAYEHGKMRRIFAQRGTGFPPGFRCRQMYHPDVGWI